MKFSTSLFCLLLLTILISCKTYKEPSTKYWLDEQGNPMKKNALLEKWREDKTTAAWKYVAKDSGMVFKLSHPTYETYKVDYDNFLKNISTLTGKSFHNKTIFLIEYNFEDDYCTSEPPNNWDSERLENRMRFLRPTLEKIENEYPDVQFLKFFNRNIQLPAMTAEQKKYFYKDNTLFIRNTVFRNPSLCGSKALIKPNGEMLVRNGEYNSYGMLEHLSEENWDLFF